MTNQIAEICGELARYRVFIMIDKILDYHTTDIARKEIEAALGQFLQTLQESPALTKVAH